MAPVEAMIRANQGSLLYRVVGSKLSGSVEAYTKARDNLHHTFRDTLLTLTKTIHEQQQRQQQQQQQQLHTLRSDANRHLRLQSWHGDVDYQT